MARDDPMTVVGQLTGDPVDVLSIHVTEHDDATRTHPAGYGNSHAAGADDRENVRCCHA
jgi:hypothetical protein